MHFRFDCTKTNSLVCQLVTPTTKKVIPRDENVDECKSRGTNRCADKNHWDRMLPTV